MAIAELLAVVPPPKRPLELGREEQWTQVRAGFEVPLPDDWKDYGMTFGTGRVGGWLQVLNPFSNEYGACMRSELSHIKLIKERNPEFPYAIYPATPGLLTWGRDDHGNRMYWLTEGPADRWPTILRTRDGEMEQWDMPMTTFLAKALSNELKCVLWTRKFAKKDCKFAAEDY